MVNRGKEAICSLVKKKALPNVVIGAAAGKAASETIKQTTGMRPLPRACSVKYIYRCYRYKSWYGSSLKI